MLANRPIRMQECPTKHMWMQLDSSGHQRVGQLQIKTGCPSMLQCTVDGTNCDAKNPDNCSCKTCKSGYIAANGGCSKVRLHIPSQF